MRLINRKTFSQIFLYVALASPSDYPKRYILVGLIIDISRCSFALDEGRLLENSVNRLCAYITWFRVSQCVAMFDVDLLGAAKCEEYYMVQYSEIHRTDH